MLPLTFLKNTVGDVVKNKYKIFEKRRCYLRYSALLIFNMQKNPMILMCSVQCDVSDLFVLKSELLV